MYPFLIYPKSNAGFRALKKLIPENERWQFTPRKLWQHDNLSLYEKIIDREKIPIKEFLGVGGTAVAFRLKNGDVIRFRNKGRCRAFDEFIDAELLDEREVSIKKNGTKRRKKVYLEWQPFGDINLTDEEMGAFYKKIPKDKYCPIFDFFNKGQHAKFKKGEIKTIDPETLLPRAEVSRQHKITSAFIEQVYKKSGVKGVRKVKAAVRPVVDFIREVKRDW